MSHPRTVISILIAATLVTAVVVVGGVIYAARRWNRASLSENGPVLVEETVSPTSTGTPDAQVTDVSTTSAAATPQPSATATASTSALPESAQAVVANFFAAYTARDATRLAQFFTADSTDELRSQHSTLFTGIDLRGNPGGPTLFATTNADQSARDYTLLSGAAAGANWIATVRETRVSGSGTSLGEVTTLLTLVPAPSGSGTWLLDAYTYAGTTGKYTAFLTQ